MVQWDEGGVKVDELKEEMEVAVEMMVGEEWEVVEALEVEVMVVEEGKEEVLEIVAVSC